VPLFPRLPFPFIHLSVFDSFIFPYVRRSLPVSTPYSNPFVEHFKQWQIQRIP